MDYNPITNFLEKFKKILFENQDTQKTITMTISKHILSEINPDAIKIKSTVIYVNTSPIIKSEILIHKQGILSDLTALLPQKSFTDIR